MKMNLLKFKKMMKNLSKLKNFNQYNFQTNHKNRLYHKKYQITNLKNLILKDHLLSYLKLLIKMIELLVKNKLKIN